VDSERRGRSRLKRLRNGVMDLVSRWLSRISPGTQGRFDAWCDRWRWSP
jgi:hypothetical protein